MGGAGGMGGMGGMGLEELLSQMLPGYTWRVELPSYLLC